jgi:hypothetical protein
VSNDGGILYEKPTEVLPVLDRISATPFTWPTSRRLQLVRLSRLLRYTPSGWYDTLIPTQQGCKRTSFLAFQTTKNRNYLPLVYIYQKNSTRLKL